MTDPAHKPYAMLGAGRLTSSLWKHQRPDDEWMYRFNVYHTDHNDGTVSHWLEPRDLLSLLKLVRVLAFELAEDGCLPVGLRQQLNELADIVDAVLASTSDEAVEADPMATTLNGGPHPR